MDEYKSVLQKYAVLAGRARRREYWMFALFNLIFSILFSFIDVLIRHQVFEWIYAFAIFVPSIAVGVRRLHDTGKSGWWFFISLIPIAGTIILIVFLATDSQPGSNEYGPNPKGADSSPMPPQGSAA